MVSEYGEEQRRGPQIRPGEMAGTDFDQALAAEVAEGGVEFVLGYFAERGGEFVLGQTAGIPPDMLKDDQQIPADMRHRCNSAGVGR